MSQIAVMTPEQLWDVVSDAVRKALLADAAPNRPGKNF